MNIYKKLSLFSLRISLGWLLFYAGITKVINPEWSAAGYLNNAKTFPAFYTWLASPGILPFINFVNEWGLTLIGISLLVGVMVRLSSIGGALMMILYYFPVMEMKPFEFLPQLVVPYIGDHAVLVDEHIIYALALLVLVAFGAGRVWSLGKMVSRGHTWLE